MKEVRRLAEYVTLIEAAELEGVKYKTMAQRLNRNPDKFDTMTEKSENGGKDAVLVAVASLSKKARNAWKERAKLKELSGTISPEGKAQPEPEAPWYVEADVDWYIENYREQWYKGMELGNVIREFLQYDGANKTEYAEQYAQEHLGSGKRTLYRYVKAYNEACAWADKLQKESGVGFEFFKVLCLCRKPKESGTFPSIKPEVKQVIKNIWFNEDFAANLGTREMLYEKLTLVANVNKWEKIPSYQTVTRYITYLMEDEGMKNAHFLASKGSREYKNKVMVKGSRDTSGLKVMQIVMGDEHTFDCWVAYKQPNGKVIPIKPHLAAWVDMRSRAIMGDVLCKDANSDILKQSLLKMMYSEPGGIPEYLYIDNGKDYTAKTMTGRDRNDRSGMDFDDTTKGFYKSIGIKDDHRALPYEPWSKGQIERFFRTVCNRFTKWFKSYTGTLTGSKTSDKVTKDIKRMCENGELLTMEEFYEEWHKWLTEVYMHTEHGGLKKAKETHKTPYDCFMNEERYFKAAPPKSYATLLMMKSENVLVRNIGIVRWGFEYRSDELCDYIGRKMDIKYDPDDMSTLYVFDKNGNPEWFDYYEPELMDFTSPEFIFVGANDPSLGKNKKSDTSSIINLAVSLKSGYMYVVDASVEKRKPDVIIEDVFEMNRRLKRDCKKGFFKFGVETVQFQYYFKEVMAKKSAEEGEYLPIEEIQSSVNKVLRIESLQPLIKNKYIKFNREHKALLKQLQEFPMGKNDDAPDGLQMAVQTAQNVKGAAIKTSYKSIIRRRFRMGKGAY